MARGRRITVTLDEAAERHLEGLKGNWAMNLRMEGFAEEGIRQHVTTSGLIRHLLRIVHKDLLGGDVDDEDRN